MHKSSGLRSAVKVSRSNQDDTDQRTSTIQHMYHVLSKRFGRAKPSYEDAENAIVGVLDAGGALVHRSDHELFVQGYLRPLAINAKPLEETHYELDDKMIEGLIVGVAGLLHQVEEVVDKSVVERACYAIRHMQSAGGDERT